MDVVEFSEGQLVTHHAAPGWGIGTIESVSGSQVGVRFWIPDERVEEVEARDLARYQYPVGEFIRSRSIGEQGIVNGVRVGPRLVTYDVRFANRRQRVPEVDVLPAAIMDDPFDLLRDNKFGDADAFVLALQARRLHFAHSYDDLVSLSNARIELLPHQVFVAHRVLSNIPPRVLLADEVGLGKTIEAGLIIKELRARGAARRVLIIVPSGLVPQWVAELRGKFNEDFTRVDSATIGALLATGGKEQLWTQHNSYVTSLHLLRGNDDHIDAIAQQQWDLIIFDEAHHLRRSMSPGPDGDRRSTLAYRMAERLQASTQALLLLTATPMQLHPFELYSLIELLDSTLFPTYRHFEKYLHTIPGLNSVVERLQQASSMSEASCRALATDIAELFKASGAWSQVSAEEILTKLDGSEATRAQLREQVEELHTLSTVMLRNRKRVVFDDLPPRRAHTLALEYSATERQAYDDVTQYLQEVYNLAMQSKNLALGFVMVTYRKMLTSSSFALRQSLLRRIQKLTDLQKANSWQRRSTSDTFDFDDAEDAEDADAIEELVTRYDAATMESSPEGLAVEIAHLRRLCDQLDAIELDAKAACLLTALGDILRDPTEKVLIFTQFKETLAYLRRLLGERFKTVVFHGDMDSVEKDATVDAFRDPAGAQVMIATEAAGEGRNLQFCHVMVNYDLPWNPMRIEQRIGRLDRIGQTHPVEIYNFALGDTLEDRVMEVLHNRINIFESTIGNLDPILGDIERDVRDLLLRRQSSEVDVDTFSSDLEQRVRDAEEMEARLTDFILDRRSFRQDRVEALLERKPAFTHGDLQTFVERFIEWRGGHLRQRASSVFEIQTPSRLRDRRGNLLRDSYTATFDPVTARDRDQLEFIAFGHELLDSAIAVCMDERSEAPARTAALLLRAEEDLSGPALCAIFVDTFTGIRPTKQLRCIAVGLDGDYLPELSARFPALALRATAASLNDIDLDTFNAVLDQCIDSAEEIASQALEAERQERSLRNAQEYQTERIKQLKFFEARRESASRDVARLEETLQNQLASQDPNTQRVAPATEGRLAAAQRTLADLHTAQISTLARLDAGQTVSASTQLFAAAWVQIAPRLEGIHTNAIT